MINISWLALFPVVALAADPDALAVGDRFPELRGKFLTGKEAVLPDAAAGKITLALLGFTYQSRFPVEAWAENFRTQFRDEPRVALFEVPMIGGLARLGKWFIDSGMRRGTPKEDHVHVITVYGDTNSWKRRLQLHDERTAQLILLDPTGTVCWRYEGNFKPGVFSEVSHKVSDLLTAR